MADAAVRAAREAGGTVLLLDEPRKDACTCTATVPGVVDAATRGRALMQAEATTSPDPAAGWGGEELVEVPLELARRWRGCPRKLRP